MPDRDDTLSEDEAGALAEALVELRPSAERSAIMKQRIMDGIHAAPQSPGGTAYRRTVRIADRQWEKRSFGLEVCVLSEDENSRSVLVRMSPGSFIPAHSHDMDEESLILEGDAQIGDDLYLTAGDYHFARAGEQHPIISSPNGCIVYVRGDRRMPIKFTPGFFARVARRLMGRDSAGSDNPPGASS